MALEGNLLPGENQVICQMIAWREKTGRAGSFVGLVSPPSNPKLQACDSQVRKELGPRLPEGRGDVG